jgi:hypothetical protein
LDRLCRDVHGQHPRRARDDAYRSLALKEPSAIRHGALYRAEHDLAFFIGKAERQNFRHEFSDLPRREIDDGKDLSADQSVRRIIFGDLRRGFLDTDRLPEIDLQLDRWFSSLRVGFGLDDRAGTDIDPVEIGKGDLR